MLPRLRALLPLLPLLPLLTLASLPACNDARSPSDETTCSTEPDCARLYRAALARLQDCGAEKMRAGYVGPGRPPPPACEGLRGDAERWAAALNRLRGRKEQEAAEEQGGGFEVPALPAPSK